MSGSLQNRGRRECRALDAPAASRAKIKKHTSRVTTVTPASPGIPRAMVLTAYSALSPVTGLVCHRRLRKGSRKLDASVGASGPHDFAVRIRRASSLRAISVHRIPPHVRDDRETPPLWDGTKSVYFCFYPGVKQNFGNSEIYARIRFSSIMPSNPPLPER